MHGWAIESIGDDEYAPGIIKPYRNIGGRFDLGWPFFGRLMLESIEYSVSKGRPTIVSKLKVLAGTVDRNTRQFEVL